MPLPCAGLALPLHFLSAVYLTLFPSAHGFCLAGFQQRDVCGAGIPRLCWTQTRALPPVVWLLLRIQKGALSPSQPQRTINLEEEKTKHEPSLPHKDTAQGPWLSFMILPSVQRTEEDSNEQGCGK